MTVNADYRVGNNRPVYRPLAKYEVTVDLHFTREDVSHVSALPLSPSRPSGFQAAGNPGCPEHAVFQRRRPARSRGLGGCWPAALSGHK